MKTKLLTFTLSSLVATLQLSQAQVCQQVVFTDQLQHLTLVRYFQECRQGHHFYGDKGVVILKRSTDQYGRLIWDLEPAIDDRYKDNPPTKWASFNGNLTLIYDSNIPSSGLTSSQTAELLSCLKEIIKGRLYIRPHYEDIWYDVEIRPGEPLLNSQTGKPIRSRLHSLQGGNPTNKTKIIFNKDGTVTVSKLV